MVYFFTHILLGVVVVLPLICYKREHWKLLLLIAMCFAVLPDIDILLSGFNCLDINTKTYVDSFDFIFNETIRCRITDTLNDGILDKQIIEKYNFEHRGITHSIELLILFIIFVYTVFFILWKKRISFKYDFFYAGNIASIAWFSHLIADFNIVLYGSSYQEIEVVSQIIIISAVFLSCVVYFLFFEKTSNKSMIG